MNYVPLYVAGPILTKKQLEQLKKDKQLEKAQEQSAWRHNHDINESKRVDYEDDNHRNSGSNNNVGSSSSNSRSGMVDGNKDSKDTQDLPDMIGRDALPRTPAAGSKFVEPEEVTEFDVRRYILTLSYLFDILYASPLIALFTLPCVCPMTHFQQCD